MLTTPWNTKIGEGADTDLMPAIQVEMKEPDVEVTKPISREEHAMPRRMYINKNDINEHGATSGCPGCTALALGRNPVAHSEACRKNIEAKVSTSDSGRKRALVADHRQKEFIAKTIENSDQEKRRKAEAPTSSSSSSSRPAPITSNMDTNGEEDIDMNPDKKRPREGGDHMDEEAEHERWARDNSLRYVSADKEKWGDIEDEDDEVWMCGNINIDSITIGELTCEEPDGMEKYTQGDQELYDDITGKLLDPEEVKVARQGELDELERLQVYDKVAIAECWKNTGRAPITARWFDFNKGDDIKHHYRSRYVAREIKAK